MAYEDQEQKRSRVVVDTPNSRREYVSSESSRVPDRSGFSGGTVAAIVVALLLWLQSLFWSCMTGKLPMKPVQTHVWPAQSPRPTADHCSATCRYSTGAGDRPAAAATGRTADHCTGSDAITIAGPKFRQRCHSSDGIK